jgi:hypothetical protein
LLLLSAATLAFEINLTRLFSVAQFYHFAFMVVSIALLGLGASGTFLAIFPLFSHRDSHRNLSVFSAGAGFSMLFAYLLINWLEFDSFSIAWDRRQVGILIVHYLALATPFFFCGLATGSLLAAAPQSAGAIYATNLLGSGLGCLIALIAPPFLGVEGSVVLCSGLALVGALAPRGLKRFGWLASVGLFACLTIYLGLRISGSPFTTGMELKISPYKSLSYALQYPGAEVIYSRWNSFSRVDLVRSRGIRSIPGLSYRFLEPPPAQDGLLVDGDELSPVILPGYNREIYQYLPAAIAYQLRPGAKTLILEPRGGLDILTALSLQAEQVTAVEVNPLIVEAASHIYAEPGVRVMIESDRSYIHRSTETYDLVVLSLANSYHPVRSGAYSLAEDYRYTVESFEDSLKRLAPGGIFVVTRWLQTPPSECLRTFALAVTALENLGADPRDRIIALRGFNTLTLLVKIEPFTASELHAVREFAGGRAYDLVYAPDIRPEETNRYNVLPESIYYQAFMDLLNAGTRQAFYEAYPYEVNPSSDDRPFYGHFFKWSQASQIIAELGKTWQPFGGAGYFVILALLLLTTILALLLILLPVAVARRSSGVTNQPAGKISPRRYPIIYLAYFSLIGFAFLLVEIPLIQRFILFLGHPAYALSAVLFSLLLFSSLGSYISERVKLSHGLGILILALMVSPALLSSLFDLALGLPFTFRLGLTTAILAPLGFLMGIPFPGGIRWMVAKVEEAPLVAWVWAANGAASVVASILAALLALTFGFSWVFRIGALCYAGAWLSVMASGRIRRFPRLPR